MDNELLKEIKETRTNYKSMIDFCCDSLILNNDVINKLSKKDFYFDLYCGDERYFVDNNGDYITEEEYEKIIENGGEAEELYEDIYQYFIIDSQAAERLAEYTNEIVFYNDQLDLYLLAVTHWGTSWEYVPANWKK